jgi:hypothetical protein
MEVEIGGIALVFYHAIARERIKINFLISNVSMGKMLPVSYWLGGPDLWYLLVCYLACVLSVTIQYYVFTLEHTLFIQTWTTTCTVTCTHKNNVIIITTLM